MLEGSRKKLESAVQHTRSSSPILNVSENGSFLSPNEGSIMTRKPIRIRRPRIPILQSGYCAICNLPYNSLEDHVQSKKHQKLIGEDTNYIALNGYIHADVGIESLLSLTGIDAIGFEDFAPKKKRRNMPRTRASSVVSDIIKPTQVLENEVVHRLRSRKTINYTSSSMDEDSFQEKPEIEPVRLEYKEYRELRSSTRALAKLTACAAVKDANEQELWESGRPKRACINRQKRISADERLVSDNKTYYKVEVLSSKLRSNDKEKECAKQKEVQASDEDKGLIVKFRKLRNSELVQLNNEATNFLFPKKDDTSDEEDEEDNSADAEKESSSGGNPEEVPSSEIEEVKPPDKFKVEDEASMDSTSSDGKRRTKRRSHAEAFIMDNQKYYKFETPGSRLRYHGSYLSPVRTKSNGDLTKTDNTKTEPTVEKEEKKPKLERLELNMNEFTFSFETVPQNEKWYQTFRRQDRVEQRYHFTHNYHWDDFVLPHQIPHLKAIDPRTCYNAYKKLKECKAFAEPNSVATSSGSEAEVCDITGENSARVEVSKEPMEGQNDEDSKLSEVSSASAATTEEIKEITSNVRRGSIKKKSEKISLSPSSARGRNARKSPRQHASTLAILSSLMHQRNRRSKNGNDESLQTIPEESSPQRAVEGAKTSVSKPTTPQKQRKKKLDYVAMAVKLFEALRTPLDFDAEFESTTNPDVSFLDCPLGLGDILNMYDDTKKESKGNCKTFFNGAPGRKPGKRKKNLTGWPNKVKRRKVIKEGNSNAINGVNIESEEDENSDSIIEQPAEADADLDNRENKCDQDIENRVGNSGEVRDTILQPYVYVKKLDNCENYSVKKIVIKSPNRRTFRRPQRRIVPQNSVKAPRMLRRSKGRWIRDR